MQGLQKSREEMKCNCLSAEERGFLYKCVLRHHKEHGSAVEFTKTTNFAKDNFLIKNVSTSQEVHEYLIGPVWNVYLHSKGQGNDNEILSSVFFIELIDLIYDSKYKIFNRVSAEIARSEFSYISSALEEMKYENPNLLKKVKHKVNEVWGKYGFLCPINPSNIPVD